MKWPITSVYTVDSMYYLYYMSRILEEKQISKALKNWQVFCTVFTMFPGWRMVRFKQMVSHQYFFSLF